MYGGQSVEKNCKGECQCEPHFARQFAPRSATQSVEKSDSVTPPLGSVFKDVAYAVIIVMRCLLYIFHIT